MNSPDKYGIYESLFKISRIAILIIDSVGLRIIDANPAAEALYGYSRDELLEMSVLDLSLEEDESKRTAERMIDGDNPHVVERKQKRKDGSVIYTEVITTIGEYQGRPAGIGQIRDITSEKLARLEKENTLEELKISGEKLRESETFLYTLLSNINVGIFVSEMNGKLLYANSFAAGMAGYDSVEEFIKVSGRELYADAGARENLVKMLAENGFVRDQEVRSVRKDGSIYWISMNLVILKDDLENSKCIMGAVEDIDHRKRIELDLIEKETRYKKLLDSSPDAIVITDLEGTILECGAAAAEMLGYLSKDELIGLSSLDFISPELNDSEIGEMKSVLDSGNLLKRELVSLKKDGSKFPAEIATGIVFDSSGAPGSLISIIKDITERKKSERSLLESESKYRSIIDTANEGVCALDGENKITFINKRLCEMVGCRAEDVIGTEFTRFFFDEDLEDNARHLENRRRGIIEKYERRIRKTDGGTLWTIVSPAQILDEDGRFQGVFAMFTDITDWKLAEQEKEKLQQQLLHAQKMEAIGQLAGGVAHDFNNILAVVIGTAEMTIRRLKPDDPTTPRLQRIIKVADRAKDLTMKLLTFARKEKLDIRTISVDLLIVELSEMLKRSLSEKIKIETILGDPHSNILIDFNQMLQAMLNLCINAGDSMPGGGMLRIETGEVALDESSGLDLRGAEPGAYCLIQIKDTGHGFDQSVKEKIFEPFFTTKERGKGTGLGLSITLDIIRGHKGLIDIESEPGAGTTVSVYLPAAGARKRFDEVDRGNKEIEGVKATILLVDDDVDFLEMTAEILTLNGFKTITAESGAKALEIYASEKAAIDIVILDMIMPDMDGCALLEDIRELNPDAKSILCSGYSIDEQARKITAGGIEGYLQKPFQSGELFRVLSTALAN